jgi:hypothetical protein
MLTEEQVQQVREETDEIVRRTIENRLIPEHVDAAVEYAYQQLARRNRMPDAPSPAFWLISVARRRGFELDAAARKAEARGEAAPNPADVPDLMGTIGSGSSERRARRGRGAVEAPGSPVRPQAEDR